MGVLDILDEDAIGLVRDKVEINDDFSRHRCIGWVYWVFVALVEIGIVQLCFISDDCNWVKSNCHIDSNVVFGWSIEFEFTRDIGDESEVCHCLPLGVYGISSHMHGHTTLVVVGPGTLIRVEVDGIVAFPDAEGR